MSFLDQRNFSADSGSGFGYPLSLSPSFCGLSRLNLGRFSGSEDSRQPADQYPGIPLAHRGAAMRAVRVEDQTKA
jgi:hypothetical protein